MWWIPPMLKLLWVNICNKEIMKESIFWTAFEREDKVAQWEVDKLNYVFSKQYQGNKKKQFYWD